MNAGVLEGVLRTTRQQALDRAGRFGDEMLLSWDVIAGVKIRNDGLQFAILVPGYVYWLEHDGIGWRLTPDGEQWYGYLVDSSSLERVGRLELAHRPLMLMRDCRYMLSQDEVGAWQLHERRSAATH